ncbi:hypothetical protein P5673_013756 [Acropora cervicornis]|uniref:Uncharacterized protein n=1 Tax=Acropora cervicornis TaxID=6130 RepID=A0AAD9QK80_ACRCE|nr:hypothetical protein P5673_013756 [Acropora cervicornis]
MIETAKSNQAKAKRKLEAVREEQKVVNTQNQNLLEKALPTGYGLEWWIGIADGEQGGYLCPSNYH